MHEEFLKFVKSYKEGEILVREEDDDTDFFCLLQGTVGIYKGDTKSPETSTKIGEISEKGEYFGEMSGLLDEERTASIIAMTDVKVLKFPGSMLSEIVIKQPKLGLKLLKSLAERLKGSTDQQQDITVQRNEIRQDATGQLLDAKETFQRVFIMLSAVEAQLRNPLTKSIVEYMGTDKLLQGGRKIRFNRELLEEIPTPLVDVVKKAYADNFAD